MRAGEGLVVKGGCDKEIQQMYLTIEIGNAMLLSLPLPLFLKKKFVFI